MNAQDWYDDTAHEDAVEHSEQVAQAGWTAMLGLSGLLGVAAIAAAVIAWPPAADMALRRHDGHTPGPRIRHRSGW
ncbi:hypothetical protein [Streptomyces sp. IBSBF 2806]|uniref:hypothetical protein n=1 Tax=Streptomyces sp. IBSBF 2806 TaxID=2903529 RepID=UPI002FDC5081